MIWVACLIHYIKSILDLRKGGEVTATTWWFYHESQPEVVMVSKEVARAGRWE